MGRLKLENLPILFLCQSVKSVAKRFYGSQTIETMLCRNGWPLTYTNPISQVRKSSVASDEEGL